MDNLDPNSSLQVEKLRNRKSRAVWQNNNTTTHNNPYANLSTGEKSRSRHNTGSSYVSPYGGGNGEENAYTCLLYTSDAADDYKFLEQEEEEI